MQELHDLTTVQIKEEIKEYMMNQLCLRAKDMFFNKFYTQLLAIDCETKVLDEISLKDGKALHDYMSTLEGNLFMLPDDWVNWTQGQDNWAKNPLMFSDIRVNAFLKDLSWNNTERREFLAYNHKFSKQKNLFCPMNS